MRSMLRRLRPGQKPSVARAVGPIPARSLAPSSPATPRAPTAAAPAQCSLLDCGAERQRGVLQRGRGLWRRPHQLHPHGRPGSFWRGGDGGHVMQQPPLCNNAASKARCSGSTFGFCCTTPLPTNGTANLIAQPKLASAWHLSLGYPCHGAGNPASATGLDIDGEPWAKPPAIGCDEYRTGAVTGRSARLSCRLHRNGRGICRRVRRDDRRPYSASRWEFGDGTVVSNRPYAARSWGPPANCRVVLRAYNGAIRRGEIDRDRAGGR